MPTQTSVQLTDATKRQVEALKLAGFGSLTDIIRIAIDRMHRDECPPVKRRIEVWQHRTAGEQYAVLTELGRPIAANGPLYYKDAEKIMAGDDDIDWSDELADAINEEDEQADDAQGAYRRVWPEPSA
jgi:hypothetical protein